MRKLDCEHLVVGAGLLGLATADHLLRRGARAVIVLERRGAPSAGRHGGPGAVLHSGFAALAEIEARGRLLLEAAEDYLEDLAFRRSGSLRLPADAPVPQGAERLAGAELAARFPDLVTAAGDARFSPSDGTVEPLALLAALHARLRAQGGRLIADAELVELREEDGGVHFAAGGRAGRAERVHLAAGVENLRFLAALGCRHPWQAEAVHSFELEGGAREGLPLWFPEARAALVPLGAGDWELEVAVDAGGSDPAVDWSLMERFRRDERVPWLAGGRIRRGRASRRLVFAPGPPLIRSRLGRIAAGGAFGAHGLGLFPAVAELLAEGGLAPLESAGGLLEEA